MTAPPTLTEKLANVQHVSYQTSSLNIMYNLITVLLMTPHIRSILIIIMYYISFECETTINCD